MPDLNNPLILRHLDDVQDFRVQDRDTPILTEELKKVPQIAYEIIKQLHKTKKDKIHFISSPQLRAQHTLEAALKELRHLLPTVVTTQELDARIRDLYHGKYIVPTNYAPGDKVPAVAVANKAYVQESFERKNIDYGNGDPLNNQYPELNGLFKQVGETQRSFSVRFYSFVYEFLKLSSQNPDTLYVLITHTAIVFRFFELVALFEAKNGHQKQPVTAGELTFREWDSMKDLEQIPGRLFVYPGEVKYINLKSLHEHRLLFLEEAEYLKKSLSK